MAEVVHLHRHGSAIAVIEMADREGRNTFTRALVAGLGVALQRVAADKAIKVVVIHGYDSIFCAGGTQEELLTLAQHKVTFDAHDFYRALLDCPVPVIAAMQGHALGGGLVFGLYADLVVMAQEAIYSANFMKYGFTPGMGSTNDLADKSDVALRLLKQAMNHRLLLDLPDAIAREKAMHETTFAQPDVIDRINQRFGR